MALRDRGVAWKGGVFWPNPARLGREGRPGGPSPRPFPPFLDTAGLA